MMRVNIHEAKTQLSRLLADLRPGEVILICKRNIPVAELRLLPKRRTLKRPIGRAKGEFEVPESFFEPLPDEILAAFEGRSP